MVDQVTTILPAIAQEPELAIALNQFILQPVILAGDPNGNPPDSPDQRIDLNTRVSPYAGVGSVGVSVPGEGDFLGSGAAISRRHILTAAHLLDLDDDGVNDVLPENVIFNLNFGRILSDRIPAESLQIFPGYQGFDDTISNDIAIITLSRDLPEGLPIYDLYRQPLTTGTTLTLVGYGTTGNGITGNIFGTASFDQKRVGQNQVDFALDGTFIYDFDGPNASSNLFAKVGSGLTLGNTIETAVGPGDSGGPSFIQNGNTLLLAGVNTFAFSQPEGFGLPGTVQGVFGTGGGGVIVSAPDKLAWINSILATLPSTGTLSGTVWEDINGDGDRDSSEIGLPGWTLYLDLNQDGQLTPSEPTSTTNADGAYQFTGLAAGSYAIAALTQNGWEQIFPTGSTNTHRVQLSNSVTIGNLNFGIRRTNPPSPDSAPISTPITGTDDNDELLGTINADVINGGGGRDRILGAEGDDQLNGDLGNDLLFGGMGSDTLNGGSGNDMLVGENGRDLLTGGAGRDRFVYTTAQDRVDRITDFESDRDLIDLRALFPQTGFENADAIADYIRLTQISTHTVISIDFNGDIGGNRFKRLTILENVVATSISDSNFWV